jgi:3-oxoacyl-[acyl-carrier protein] reductase
MSMLTLDLTGRTALVTGASGDLGRVISRTLADCGARVAVHYNSRPAEAERVVAAIRAAGGAAEAVQADLTSEGSVQAMAATVGARLGEPEIVVANAVIQYTWTSVLQQSLADFDGQYRSGVLQAVLLAKAFAPAMQRRKRGRFIGISTECATQCNPNQGAYAAGKRGMDAVYRVLCKELGPDGITVNQVAPGWMVSDRYRGAAGGASQPAYEAEIPLRRRGDDADIAQAVAFLASDHADFITGAGLPVCGGHVMAGI